MSDVGYWNFMTNICFAELAWSKLLISKYVEFILKKLLLSHCLQDLLHLDTLTIII